MEGIQVIGFDADDTLWVNETYFLETEQKLRLLLAPYVDGETVSAELFRTESRNMPLYGYGVKAYILSVIETAIRITNGKVPAGILEQIILLGKEQLSKPVELLDGVEDTLNALVGRYHLIVVTKGDLLDQERKLQRSGIAHYFDHTEIMTDKAPEDYQRLISSLDVAPQSFLMVGNSLKSDVLPVLSLGGQAIHVPAEAMWKHEEIHPSGKEYLMIRSLAELPEVLRG